EGSYRFKNNRAQFVKGNTVSGLMEIEITNPALFTGGSDYVLPISIANVVSKDKGIVASENRSTAYLYVPYNYTNVDTVQTAPTAPNLDRVGWAITVSNSTSGATGPSMIDGNNSTAWRSSNSSTAAKWFVVNMGGVKTINSFSTVPNYVATAENITEMTVLSSNDNATWKKEGVWKGTGPVSGSSAVNPSIKGITFLTPVTAQYFRFEITKWTSGNRVGVAEIYAQ